VKAAGGGSFSAPRPASHQTYRLAYCGCRCTARCAAVKPALGRQICRQKGALSIAWDGGKPSPITSPGKPKGPQTTAYDYCSYGGCTLLSRLPRYLRRSGHKTAEPLRQCSSVLLHREKERLRSNSLRLSRAQILPQACMPFSKPLTPMIAITRLSCGRARAVPFRWPRARAFSS
jgi:hypothetical protein